MRSFLTALAFCASVGFCAAQSSAKPTTLPSDSLAKESVFRKNNVKINLSSVALNNYSFSFERMLTPKMSFVAGYRFMPNTNLGDMAAAENFANVLLTDENDLKDHLDKANFANQAFTGELRYYMGKHAGARGFYVAAYGRYTDMNFTYQDTYQTVLQNYDLPYKGKLNGVGGGLMVGAQWLIADRITLDWYIVGAHYGKMGGEVNIAQDLRELSESQKQELEADIEKQFTIADRRHVDATVTDTGVHGKVDAPFAGFRGFGVNIGIAF